MTSFLVILTILLIILATGGLFFFLHARRTFREQKNFERGLKMVSMLIRLPPTSEDIETSSGRDNRDIVEENISKAQVLYNIIASTYHASFKTRFYGQRHFAFEIVGSRGFVNFYVAVPIALLDVVQQAIVSAYPAARLEEVADHNIFSPVGRISGTMGGELTLKEKFFYPIATYQDLKRDALQSILNAMSTLEKDDGAAIQILIRPTDSGWRKKASAEAAKKRKGGKDNGKGLATVGSIGKDFFTALTKPPEGKDEHKDGDKKELSSLEQSVLDSIEDKTRYPGFEVLIRVVSSSNIAQRSQAVLNNIVASFALFDAPGKNGFRYTAARDIESFVTSYILRFFPPESNSSILNTVELATIFHFPDQRNIPTSQLERQASKQVDGPRNMPENGLLLGYNVFRGSQKKVYLSEGDRARHMYAVGQTGTGKSTFLENLALQDMLNGEGFAFIDPHGDTAENLLAMVPRERTEDVIYFSPADMEYPMGLNMFEFHNADQKDFLIQEAISMLYKLYDPQHQGIIGPRYEHLFRMAALTVMADPAGGTFIDIPKLFSDTQYVNDKLKYVTDQTVLDFWQKEMPQSQRSNEFGEVKSWFVSKFGAFLSNTMMRNIIGQTRSSFDLRDIMDNKKILLVNLSKGRVGELNSKLLGMIFVMKFQAAAMSRATLPESERVNFALYVDEFQNFSTDSFATIMSEARKYHLSLIVANQFTTQLSDEIRDAVFGNMGTIVSFRIGQNDVDALSKYFQPLFDGDDLLRIPNFNTVVRTLIGGVPTQPFSMMTLPPLGEPNKQLAGALKQLSAAKHGRPRVAIEDEITERLKTKSAPRAPAPPAGHRPGFGQPGFGAGSDSPLGPPGSPQGGLPGKPASFLDEWLSKREQPLKPLRTPFGNQPPAGGSGTPVGPQSQPLSPPPSQPQPPQAPTPPSAVHQVQTKPLQPVANANEPKKLDEANDTIYIDKEGNLQQRAE